MINTHTLTCSNCGSAQFSRQERNEYRCLHCGSVTLVEDDVAQRLETILRRLQQPAPRTVAVAKNKQASVTAILVILAALIFTSVLTPLLMQSHYRAPGSASSGALESKPLEIEGLHRVQASNSPQILLVGFVHNATNKVLTPRMITVIFYRDRTRLFDSPGMVNARYLLPGERASIKVPLFSSTPYTRYETKNWATVADGDYRGRARISLSKGQLVKQKGKLFFIGILSNEDKVEAKNVRFHITLYDNDKNIIGIGDATPYADILSPEEKTTLKATFEMYSDAEIGSYDYLIESEKSNEE